MLGGRTCTRFSVSDSRVQFTKAGNPPVKLFQPEDHGIVEHGAGGQVAVSAKDRLGPVPEKQFVAMHPAAQIQDRLARHIAQPVRKLGRGRRSAATRAGVDCVAMRAFPDPSIGRPRA